MIDQAFISSLTSTATTKKNIYGAVLCVEKGDDSFSYVSVAGNMSAHTPYYIASVTKLYVTAVLLKLKEEGRVDLEHKISNYLPSDTLQKLHYFKGHDYSNEITIKHLMSNTSGIPDYFTADAIKELIGGRDSSWGYEKVIASAKKEKPKFAPGVRAQYSDTNYQLLGKIIETITEKDIHSIFKELILKKLELKETYVYEDENDSEPAPFYYKDMKLHLPKYTSSIGPEGGIVSTAKESMTFIKAFMNGRLFPKQYLNELKEWKLLWGPGLFYYGVGIASQPISLKEFKAGLIGHWGQTGSFAFYHPKTDLYFTGTVNQFYGHSVAAKMMIKIIKACK